MNINQLEYLIAAIDLGSYADAAKSLYVTPQAVET
jgi:DNA-binding transcriptional LysR family regulator